MSDGSSRLQQLWVAGGSSQHQCTSTPSRRTAYRAARRWQVTTTQKGTWNSQEHGDDAHGLLRIIAAMAEQIERGRSELRAPGRCCRRQTASGARTARRRSAPEGEQHEADLGRHDDGTGGLQEAGPDEPAFAWLAPTRPDTRACEELDGMAKTHVRCSRRWCRSMPQR